MGFGGGHAKKWLLRGAGGRAKLYDEKCEKNSCVTYFWRRRGGSYHKKFFLSGVM